MKAIFPIVALLILVSNFNPVVAQDERATLEEFKHARAQAIDASLRSDSTGVKQAITRLEALLQEESVATEVQYTLAFATWQRVYMTYGAHPHARKLMGEAMAHLDNVVEHEADHAEAYALKAFCYFYYTQADTANVAENQAAVREMLDTSLKLNPTNHPGLFVAAVLDVFSGAGGEVLFQEAIRQYEQDDTLRTGWWLPTAYSWLAGVYLFRNNLSKVQEIADALQEIRPDHEMLNESIRPSLEKIPIRPAPHFDEDTWTQLATDAEEDGQTPIMPDVKSLAYVYDAPTDSLWFRYDLNSLPDVDTFGLNLVVDTDQDQTTGIRWWGANRAFTFDQVVTVWVTKDEHGTYRGVNGISDAKHAWIRRMVYLKRNNIALHVDAENLQLTIGFKRTDLDGSRSMDVIGAVGSNQSWNDDVLDVGSATVEIAVQ